MISPSLVVLLFVFLNLILLCLSFQVVIETSLSPLGHHEEGLIVCFVQLFVCLSAYNS